MFDVPPLLTERLALRVLDLDVANFIVEAVPQPYWASGFPQDGDMDISRIFASNPPTSADGFAYGPRQIRLRDSDLLIGTAGFFGPPSEQGEVELGYGVVPDFRGQGLATEALGALIAFASSDERVRLIKADVLHANLASQRVMERCGMVRVSADDALYYYELTPLR